MSTNIAGTKNPEHLRDNVAAASRGPLPAATYGKPSAGSIRLREHLRLAQLSSMCRKECAMEPSCVQYRLTDEERRTFDETGNCCRRCARRRLRSRSSPGPSTRPLRPSARQGHDPKTALFYPNFIPDRPAVRRPGGLRAGPAQGLGHSRLEHLSLPRPPDRHAAVGQAARRQDLRLAPGQRTGQRWRWRAIRGRACR